MLSNWVKFNKFLIENGILIIVYVGILIYRKSIWGHDEYGLAFLFRLAICLFTRLLIVLNLVVVKIRQLKKQLLPAPYIIYR